MNTSETGSGPMSKGENAKTDRVLRDDELDAVSGGYLKVNMEDILVTGLKVTMEDIIVTS